MSQTYNDPPPAYSEAPNAGASASSSRLQPVARNGIPPEARRSMEDESRPLPKGWVRRFDERSHHQFFVDTTVNPPRSIWHHPHDDEQYLSTLSSEERERIQDETSKRTHADIIAEDTDDDDEHDHKGTHHGKAAAATTGATSAAAGVSDGKGKKKESLGQKMKDKLTGTTHEEREKERAKRAEAERRAYQQHVAFRQAMARAAETGQPQLVGKDKQGHDVFIEPPQGPGAGYNMQPGAYEQYNPYANGPYRDPNARFIRPDYGYSRPYGYGYGGGYGYGYGGMGLGFPLLAGMGGGLLLGGMLGGF